MNDPIIGPRYSRRVYILEVDWKKADKYGTITDRMTGPFQDAERRLQNLVDRTDGVVDSRLTWMPFR